MQVSLLRQNLSFLLQVGPVHGNWWRFLLQPEAAHLLGKVFLLGNFIKQRRAEGTMVPQIVPPGDVGERIGQLAQQAGSGPSLVPIQKLLTVPPPMRKSARSRWKIL